MTRKILGNRPQLRRLIEIVQDADVDRVALGRSSPNESAAFGLDKDGQRKTMKTFSAACALAQQAQTQAIRVITNLETFCKSRF
jgi:hypothetical protein